VAPGAAAAHGYRPSVTRAKSRQPSVSQFSSACSSGAEECDHAKNFNQSSNLLAKQWRQITLRQFEKREDEQLEAATACAHTSIVKL